MISWFFTICIFLFSLYLYTRWSNRKLYAFASKLDGPSHFEFLSSSIIIGGKKAEEIVPFIMELIEKYGTLYRAWLGPFLAISVSSPEDVEVILNSCPQKGFFYKFFNCENGLITAPPEIWKVHRKLLNSSFNLRILKSFIPIFNEKTIILANSVENMIGKGEFDIYQLMKRCTLDMICATTLGINSNYQKNVEEGDRATNAVEKYLASVSQRIFNIFMYPDFVYKWTRAYKISEYNRAIAEESSVKIIKIKQESLQSSVKVQKSEDEFEYRKPQIFIDQIMQLSKETDVFDSQAILDEIDTMFLAGQETSALTVAHTILLLAIHQDIQQKVVDELENVWHDSNEHVDYETLSKLEYLDMVVKESLRLFPVAPLVIRKTTEETQIVSRNLVIPAGVIMVIPIYKIHRDPKEWGPNADEFNPENFRPGNSTKRHNCSYIPFSHGPRNCMGKVYATMSIKFLLVNLLKKCKFHTTYTMETLEKKFEITLKLNHEHSVTVERRKTLN